MNETTEHEQREDDAESVTLRIPAALKSALVGMAREAHRTLSGEIRMALEKHTEGGK